MGQPAAVFGSVVTAVDTHLVLQPSGPPVPLPTPFAGRLAVSTGAWPERARIVSFASGRYWPLGNVSGTSPSRRTRM